MSEVQSDQDWRVVERNWIAYFAERGGLVNGVGNAFAVPVELAPEIELTNRALTVYLTDEEIETLGREAKEAGRSGVSAQIRFMLAQRRRNT